MSDYANARFKSPSLCKYVVPKLAREYQPPSNPFTEQGTKLTLSKNKNMLKSLENRSRVIAECSIRPKVYDKVANSVQFSSLGRPSLIEGSLAKEIPVRVITQPKPNASGTITASSKPVPIVEHVGQIYQHPTMGIGEKLIQQEAMRNIANLPDLLEKLQRRLSVLPHQLNVSAMGAASKPPPLPPPPPPVSRVLVPSKATSQLTEIKPDSSQSKSFSSKRSTKKPSAQPKKEGTFENSVSSLTESSGSYDASSSSSQKRKAKATGFIKYLQEIKAVLNENDGETEVNEILIDDMKEKGFNIPATRAYKTEKGLHSFIAKQISTLGKVLEE